MEERTSDLLKKNEELEKEARLLAAAEERIRQLAYYDPLTRLPNRYLLNDRLAQIIAASRRSKYYCALMFLDLDNFKQLNDTYGHSMGDLLLMEVAYRITGSVREVDTVARLGGDEFVVVLNKLDTDEARSAAQASIIAERVRVAIEMPYVLVLQQEGKPDVTVQHRCTSSVGVAL
ncbi:MAG: GGDEF domain-containing protein, partial [Gallionellaceae bacterium]|nr:GGDEF domain-containing protein [Gallionellaceae bacterium]